ncbi:MAG: 4Fe-4S binding protein [Hyphomicrobiaceae bacterium]
MLSDQYFQPAHYYFLIFLFAITPIKFSETASAGNAPSAASSQRSATAIEAEIKNMYGVYGVVDVGRREKADNSSGAAWVWPVFHNRKIIGYAFNSLEIAPLPGFSGHPIELLIAINVDGTYRDVRVLHHAEPMFVAGYYDETLDTLAEQYKGQKVKDRISVMTPGKGSRRIRGKAYIDGISAATISVEILNDSVVRSAIKIATSKIKGFQRVVPAMVNQEYFEEVTWSSLVKSGRIAVTDLARNEVYKAFDATKQPFRAAERNQDPTSTFSNFGVTQINVPSIGRYLLGEAGYQKLMKRELEPGDNAILVFSNGPYSFLGEDFVPSTSPERLHISQGSNTVEVQDINFYNFLKASWPKDMPKFKEVRLLRISAFEAFDPSQPWDLNLNVIRGRSQLTEGTTRAFPVRYQLPQKYFIKQNLDAVQASQAMPLWLRLWTDRWVEIVFLLAGLTLLTAVILNPARFTKNASHFEKFRWAYLLYTIGFIGYYTQGQLSVTHIFTMVQSTIVSSAMSGLLLDPIICILGVYTIVTLLVWGRGFFCGWLCPFGAMQEVMSWIGQKLRLPQIRIPWMAHSLANKTKYVIFVGLIATSIYSLTTAEVLAEVEPFKTALTMSFVRSWPYVAYAGTLLFASMFIHKFFCRYICPLGAALAIVGKFRAKDSIPRRSACGSPCQLCSVRCQIKAIKPSGEIDYDECVQCYECVVIHDDKNLCVPLVQRAKMKARQNSIGHAIS